MEYIHEIIVAIILVAGLLTGILLLGTKGIKISHYHSQEHIEQTTVPMTPEEKEKMIELTEKEQKEQEQRTQDYYAVIRALNEALGGMAYDDKE